MAKTKKAEKRAERAERIKKNGEKKSLTDEERLEPETDEKRQRDFVSDLHEYVEKWKNKTGWKFNKVLQTYALDNCLDFLRIDEPLFTALLPYIESVVGVARQRLLDSCGNVIEESDEGEDRRKSRAKEIIDLLS